MKFLLLGLLLPLTLNAAGNPPKPKVIVIPPMTWAVKPMIRAGAVLSAEDARRLYEASKQKVDALKDPNAINEMIQQLGAQITQLSDLSQEQAAMEIIDAIFALIDLGEQAKKDATMAGGAAFSFVVYPSSVEALKAVRPLDDFAGFSAGVIDGMHLAQEAYRQAPKNDRQWNFLGAVGNARISSRGADNDVHLQLVLGLKPQTIEQGGNTVVIPDAATAADSPVAIIDISLPLELTLPKIELTFGKLGELKSTSEQRVRVGRNASRDASEWRFRFEAEADGMLSCSRAKSTPLVLKTMKGIPLAIPIYYAKIDGNDQRMTGADARLAGFSFAHFMCWDPFKQVSAQVIQTVNGSITDSTFSDILGLSLRELAERVQRMKEKDAKAADKPS